MANKTTIQETDRSPIDGTEAVRLATTGANWKATLAAIKTWLAIPAGANPTATIGTAAVNGSASTFMRSDGAPAINQAAAFAFSNLSNTLVTANGALSSSTGPAIQGNGTWISGGTATTTKPYLLIEPTGTTSTAWSTSGTGLGINAASGFTGNIADLQINSISVFRVTAAGAITTGAGATISGSIQAGTTSAFAWNGRASLTSPAAGIVQHGAADTASPVAQTIKFQDGSGTDRAAAATATILGPAGTGTGTNGDIVFKTGVKTTTGTAAATQTTALTLKGETQRVVAAKTIGTGGFTVATLPAGVQGDRTFVTDALAPTFLATLVGGGAIVSTAFFDGATWTAQ